MLRQKPEKMKNISIKNNRIFLLLAAFLFPILVMTVCGTIVRIEPFGSNGFMISDINAQFNAFFTYWQNTVLSPTDNFKYSLIKTLGGDMKGFAGYYLNNPFLYFLLLFPKEKISVGIYWMMTVQIGFMGLTFELMLDEKYKPELRHLIFSWGYALCGYSIAFLASPIYRCDLILLPVVIMGLDMIIEKRFLKGTILYSLSLAAAIWCNYYLGYMICIFCGLYIVINVLFGKDICKIRSFAITVGASILGVIISLPSLIPTLKSLSGQKTSDLSFCLNLSTTYRPGALLYNFFPGQFKCDYTNLAAPYVYIGILPLLCIVLFLFNRKIALSEKIRSILLLAVLFVSTWIYGLDCIWHGFNEPVGFSHRQTFILAFTLLMVAASGLEKCTITKRADGNKIMRAILALLIIVQACDLTYNAIESLKAYESAEMDSLSDYETYYTKNKAIIDRIKSENEADDIYRIEKDYERNHNDSMMFDYAGLSHNSSCEKEYVKQFMARLGFRNQGIWAYYGQGSTTFADCLLGVKYFISRYDETVKPYEDDFSYEDSYVYKNPYSLGIAWCDTAEHADKTDMKALDLFTIQNGIAGCEIYTKAESTLTLDGMSESRCVYDGESTDDILGVRNSGTGTASDFPKECLKYELTNDGGKMEYHVTAQSDCNLYCYFPGPCEQNCELYVNGEDRGDYFSDYRWGIINCGSYKAGESAVVTLEPKDNALLIYEPFFYEENIDMLKEWYENVTENEVSVQKISSSHMILTVDNKDDCDMLIFSLPYEEGWTALADGKSVEPEMVYDCLMAVPISKDTKTVEMIYK